MKTGFSLREPVLKRWKKQLEHQRKHPKNAMNIRGEARKL
jgi:hypothetical protein